jgi:hypothetical protein
MTKTLTPQVAGALQWLASRGEMRVSIANEFIHDTVSRRTAWALERRGYAERRWAGGEDNYIYITHQGQEAADALLSEDDDR